jgi:glycosyltransferase involved in cell wall biosynthesis
VKPVVCLFSDSLAPSGVGEHMLTLARQLQDRYALSLICPPSPSGLRLLDRAAQMGLATLPLEVRGARKADRCLADWISAQRVTIFHCHAGVAWEGHAGIRAARAADVPKVVRTEHLADLTSVFEVEQLPDLIYSPYHRNDCRLGRDELTAMVAKNRAAQQQVIELVDRLICVSAGVGDSFRRSGIPAEKMSVVRNGIQPLRPSGSADEARKRLDVGTRTKLVLTIGRLIDVKGHHYLLDAMPTVVARHQDVRFLWVGGGPLEQELRDRVRTLDLDDHVQIAGQRNDIPDLMAAADLLVLPSLVEGLPLVVLEAMAAGLPVVATRVCGTSETLVDGVTGRLVPPGRLGPGADGTALAAAILEVLQDDGLGERWGAAGRARLERDFTADRMAHETADVYERVLLDTAARDGNAPTHGRSA